MKIAWMPLETVKLIIGLFLAIKGADVLISSSIGLGRKFKVSEVLINMPYRGSGNSKMAFKHLLIWFLTIFKFRFFG